MLKDDARVDGSLAAAREIDRRTIAKGVAWTVPVVIVATAAPAAAASGTATIQSVAATYVPAVGSANATVSLVITVKGTGAGNSVTFSGLSQGTKSYGFVGAQNYPIGNETKSFSMTTAASDTIAAAASTLNYMVNTGSVPDFPVSISAVTAFASQAVAVTKPNAASCTFTFGFGSPKNDNSRLAITSVVTPGKKNNGDPGPSATWAGSAFAWNDIVNGVSVTLQRPQPAPPSQVAVWDQTVISGSLDNVNFSFIVNAT